MLTAFRNASIKHKLTTIMMLTCSVVLLLTSAAFLTNEVMMFRRALVAEMASLAEAIGMNNRARSPLTIDARLRKP